MPRPKKSRPNRSDGRYEVKITIDRNYDGSLIRKSFYSDISKEDARRQAEEYKVNIKARELAGIPQMDDNVTFGDWAYVWLEKYKLGTVSEHSYDDTYKRPVESYLLPEFGQCKLTSITPVDVQSFLNRFALKYSDETLKKVKNCLKNIFETAIENDKCIKNPAKNISSITSKVEKVQKRTYKEEDAATILTFAETHKFGLYIKILLELGLRCSELCGLKWSDIDFDEKTIFVERAVTPVKNKPNVHKPKTKTSCRILPLSTKMVEALAAAMAEAEKQLIGNKNIRDEFIMQTVAGNLFTDSSFTKYRYKPFFKDLHKAYPDIECLTPHELRHTCGTLLYKRTKDLYAVSKYLGHSSVEITAKLYVHDSVDLLRTHLQIE